MMSVTRLSPGLTRRGGGAASYQEILDAVSAVDSNASVWNPDDPNTLTSRESGGSTFASQVDDGLGNRASLVMASEARQPELTTLSTGRLAWSNDGSDKFMLADFASDIAQPFTILLVGRRAGSSQYFVDSDATDGGRVIVGYEVFGSGGEFWAGSWVGTANTSTERLIRHINVDGVNSEAFLNGTSYQTGDAGANALGGVGILQRGNNTAHLDGDLAFVVVFPTKRTNAELADLRALINENYPIGTA